MASKHACLFYEGQKSVHDNEVNDRSVMNQPKNLALLLATMFVLPLGAWAQPNDDPKRHDATELNVLIARHQFERAEETVRHRLETGEDPAAIYCQIGKAYFDHELWQRSAGFLEKSLELKHTNDEAHRLLGLDLRMLHRPEDAESELLEAAKQNPSNRVNVYFAGHQLILNGKFETALPYLYTALDSKPLHTQALQALALAQARLGNYGLAESYYRKAIDSSLGSDDGHYAALINLSILLLLDHDPARLEEGLSCARRAEKLQSDSSDAHFLTGKALFKLGRLREATPELARAAKLNPQDSKPHFLLGQIYDQLGQHDLARKERESVTRSQSLSGQAGMATVDPVPLVPE
jgi:Flp pilus assembly protein TadD